MTEEARQLKQEIANLREEVMQRGVRIEELEGLLMRALLRIEELERRLAKDSHNSSKPPSSDGLKRKLKSRRHSGRSKGGQPGHQGHTLEQVAAPDQVITHRPTHCEACQSELQEVAGQVKERRQVLDLPELRLLVSEHRVEGICCPACQHVTQASFPAGVDAPAQYGPQVQALAVYLSQFQLLPMERVCELVGDLWGCQLCEGTLANWIAEAARTLEPTLHTLKRLLLASHVNHLDETGGRIKGLLHWFHVCATTWLTLYCWHHKRGQQAMHAMGLLPHYTGRAMHDRWSSYDQYACAHSVCGAHLLRDCLFVAEHDQQPWAQAMYELLLRMKEAAEQWRAQGAKAIPQAERDEWVSRYFSVLADGFAAHLALAPPGSATQPKKMGRPKQDASKNLLDALLKRAEQVLAFLDDLAVPFTNNQAERDLRMSHPFSKRFLAPFAASTGPRPFVPFAVISPPCASKVVPCWLPWLLSSMALLFRLRGSQGPE